MGAEASERMDVLPDPYGELLSEFSAQVGEGEPSYGRPSRSVREEIVRCIWFGGHFGAEGLATDDGRRIEVRSPGWWNVEGGPDFVRAEFLLEGEGRVVGDVEVHTLTSGWRGHGHHRQPEYADVALHVVMWNDTDGHFVQSAAGKDIPQLTLSRSVGDDLEELVEIVDPDAEPHAAPPAWEPVQGKYCGQAYRDGELEPEWLGRLLDAAGNHRLLSRAAAIAELFENHPREQILYERISEALGYKNNRMPFLQLAGLLPVAELRRAVPADAAAREKAEWLEAAFFTIGGFLERAPKGQADAETRQYCEGLKGRWQSFGEDMGRVRLTSDHWQLSGVRPVNRPARRIAALAALLGEHLHTGLLQHFVRLVKGAQAGGRRRLDVAARNALLDAFCRLEHPYWSWRFSFSGQPLGKPKALVGKERAMSIVVDVLLPVLLAHGRTEGDPALCERLLDVWRGLPRRQENAVTRRMQQAIFPEEAEARKVVCTARRQQGLHQLYRDCCRAEGGCDRCAVYLAHTSGRALSPV